MKVLNGKKFYNSELLQYSIQNEKINNKIDLTNRENTKNFRYKFNNIN